MSYPGVAILILSLCFLAYKLTGGRTHTESTESDIPLKQRLDDSISSEYGNERQQPPKSEIRDDHDSPYIQVTDPYHDSTDQSGLLHNSLSENITPSPPSIDVTATILDSASKSTPDSTSSPSSWHPKPQNFGMLPPPKPGRTYHNKQSIASVSTTSALKAPDSIPIPPRELPATSQQRASGGRTANGELVATTSRGKVLLAPGHSPLDWAAKSRSENLAGVATFQRVTPSQLRNMTGRKGKPAWSSWNGKVYNLTPYLPFHPGGEHELLKAAGRDGTKLFMEVHPWVNWENMLGSCLVGALVQERGSASSELEAID